MSTPVPPEGSQGSQPAPDGSEFPTPRIEAPRESRISRTATIAMLALGIGLFAIIIYVALQLAGVIEGLGGGR